MQTRIPIIIISLSAIFLMAFIPSETLFQDDFEGHLNEATFKRDYQVWESGAVLNIFLEDEYVNSGKNALGVEIVSPNPLNQSKYGSVFRTLEFSMGNWSGAAGVSFWISNPNDTPLKLSFNLKERYREYWAVAEEGVFYLQNSEDIFSQQEILYSNLPIPAQFSGFVVLPFVSLEVPDWNTAQSDQVLDSKQIESYAFSITVDENTPFTFYIDDFKVLGPTTFYKLPISGETQIQILSSGELTETYKADFLSLENQEIDSAGVNWSIQEPYDSKLSISEEGTLRIPADTPSAVITLLAQLKTPEFTLINSYDVALENTNNDQMVTNTPVPEPASLVAEPATAYDRFSTQFDAWTTKNRALFVGLLILGVTIFLFVLSSIEQKLK